MSLGSRLRSARISKGYRLRKAQAMSGVGFSTISKAERDVGEIGSQHLEKLAKAYGVTMDSLMLDNAPSFRADAATVRRAVLLADLEAMGSALTVSHEPTELRVAQMLITVAYAIKRERVSELCEVMADMMLRWLAGAAAGRDGHDAA